MTEFIITNVRHCLTGFADRDARFAGAIRVREGMISEMGDLTPGPNEHIVDARGCLVVPGFINTHHHLFQSLMKSAPGTVNAGLDDWVMRAPYTFWPKLDEDAFRTSVEVGLAEMVLSGTTTVSDLHYVFSDRYDYDPAEVLVETARRFGIRFVLGRGGLTHGRPWHGVDLPPAPTETIEAMLAGIESAAGRWHDPSPDAMTKVAATPVTTVFNLRPGEVREVAQVARRLGLRMHTHLSENRTYVESTLERFGKRPVHWMAEQDWIGDDVWFAHLVECDDDELGVLAEARTAMAHCPQSNARLGSGDSRRRRASTGWRNCLPRGRRHLGQRSRRHGPSAILSFHHPPSFREGRHGDVARDSGAMGHRWRCPGPRVRCIGTLRAGMAADIAVLSLDGSVVLRPSRSDSGADHLRR